MLISQTVWHIFSLCLLLPTSVIIAEAPTSYALGEVSIHEGGNAIRNQEDRILLNQVADTDCKISSPLEVDERPAVAGRRGGIIFLEVDLLGCRRAKAPAVSCGWTIRPAETFDASCLETVSETSGQVAWVGWDSRFDLKLPESTGVYELALDCEMSDGDTRNQENVEWPLFVTYADPLAAFSPPDFEWYARAACWAAGLGPEATEENVLEGIISGLYRYGAENWRYGYANRVAPGHFSFPVSKSDTGKTSYHYEITHEDDENPPPSCSGDPPTCKCKWQALVDSRSVCKFADCYIFSDVFHSMSAVHGVGGLRSVSIYGEGNRGFLTKSCQSLDPSFRSNVDCETPAHCADVSETPYYFGNHSLRQRGEIFYDSTFNNRYRSPEEPIALSREFIESNNEALMFKGDDRAWRFTKVNYGNWRRIEPGDAAKQDLGSPGGDTRLGLRLTGNTDISTRDYRDDGIVDLLKVEVEVEVLKTGEYALEAILLKEGQRVAQRPDWTSSRHTGAIVQGSPGRYRPTMAFSGEEIYRSGLDGPYTLRIVVPGAKAPTDLVVVVEDFDASDFGEAEGLIAGLRFQEDGEKPSVIVELEARRSSELGLDLRFSRHDETLGYAGIREDFFKGRHEVVLAVPEEIESTGSWDGVELTVVLYGELLEAIDDLHTRLPLPGGD